MNPPLCECGNICRKRYRNGKSSYRSYCYTCENPQRKSNKQRQRDRFRTGILTRFRTTDGSIQCGRCGFKPEDEVQIDINHRDGNRENNDPTNHELLCSNCHRLVTKWGGHTKNLYQQPKRRWVLPKLPTAPPRD